MAPEAPLMGYWSDVDIYIRFGTWEDVVPPALVSEIDTSSLILWTD
jgi:hypothetical protein